MKIWLAALQDKHHSRGLQDFMKIFGYQISLDIKEGRIFQSNFDKPNDKRRGFRKNFKT